MGVIESLSPDFVGGVAAGAFTGAAIIAGRGISKFLLDMDTAFDAITSRRVSGGR